MPEQEGQLGCKARQNEAFNSKNGHTTPQAGTGSCSARLGTPTSPRARWKNTNRWSWYPKGETGRKRAHSIHMLLFPALLLPHCRHSNVFPASNKHGPVLKKSSDHSQKCNFPIKLFSSQNIRLFMLGNCLFLNKYNQNF